MTDRMFSSFDWARTSTVGIRSKGAAEDGIRVPWRILG